MKQIDKADHFITYFLANFFVMMWYKIPSHLVEGMRGARCVIRVWKKMQEERKGEGGEGGRDRGKEREGKGGEGGDGEGRVHRLQLKSAPCPVPNLEKKPM